MFCENCGTPVRGKSHDVPKKNKSSAVLIIGIIITALAIILCAMCILFLWMKKQEEISDPGGKSDPPVVSVGPTIAVDISEEDDESFDEESSGDEEDSSFSESDAALEFVDPKQMSAGYTHTIAIDGYGFINAYGDNSYGQCNVENWTDIVSLAAGEGHSVGLRSDGTVVAVGNNDYGQCNVQNWTDIVEIATYYKHTVGLRSDGTVVATGHNEYGQCDVQNWTNIKAIGSGVYHTLGVREDGTVVAAGFNDSGQCNVQNWTNVEDVFGGWHHSIGLRADGTLEAIGSNEYGQIAVGNVRNAADVVCGEVTTLVFHSQGSFSSFGIPKEASNEIDNWYSVVQISGKNNHFAALNEQGIVFEVGKGYSKLVPDGMDMESWSITRNEKTENSETASLDIYKMLVDHYRNEDVTVMEGVYSEDGSRYETSVRCGVPGNPSASQRLYEIDVDLATGEVVERNVIVEHTNTYDLF